MIKHFALLLTICTFLTACTPAEALSEEESCSLAGGEWVEFPDTCTDSCTNYGSDEVVFCGQALTSGCDCGTNLCWDAESGECEDN